ncbi:MAG: helix-turn-helix domain-containing protein [Chloroflexota bacterium]|nr:helix-turn-helix domain-containing protein [Chloroflexota bacterium]
MSLSARDSRQALPPTCWPDIVRRAEHEGLRAIARDYGVSPHAVRTVLRKTGHAHLLNDEARRQRLTARVPLPPPAPAKIPRDRYGEVVLLCQRHTQAEVAALLGVSQATIWRILQQAQKQPGLGDPESMLF